MNRPVAEVLTERELEVMHAFWKHGEQTAQDARDRLEQSGRPLTYTTVATLCRLLWEKGFLQRLGEARPYSFRPTRSFEDVSKNLVSSLIERVFGGSRKQLMLQVLEVDKLSARHKKMLEEILHEHEGELA